MEPLSSEAVIDIKPELDDDLISEELVEISTSHGRTRGSSSRPTAEIYRPGHSKYTPVSSADTPRSMEGPSHYRNQDGRSRSFRTGSSKVCFTLKESCYNFFIGLLLITWSRWR